MTEYAYRFEDQRYSIADEYGDHAYTQHTVKLYVYAILKRTKCGIQIDLNYSLFPRLPDTSFGSLCYFEAGKNKRFVNLEANKKFALPSIREAAESYRARKKSQIRIYEARISGAHQHLDALRIYMRNPEVEASL